MMLADDLIGRCLCRINRAHILRWLLVVFALSPVRDIVLARIQCVSAGNESAHSLLPLNNNLLPFPVIASQHLLGR